MTEHLIKALDQTEQADAAARARLEKILKKPQSRREKKKASTNPAWMKQLSTAETAPEQDSQPQADEKAPAHLSADERWKMAAALAAAQVAEEMNHLSPTP